ncbi:Cu(I)/Ag(I) efflux system membrane fusion protein [Marinilabilia salmonicolor]|jgi:Cu(I)/Ag(I) efflux system membrane fusion protein|uniref:efflux RND transporter periplasmic adaptor subunit n=1 Tax=Marinilabilia salmonicolor TaxID=989 RepID=UPI000D05507C|nr:efflux RND transporter periplasmic adaptor subunit [Marinilabilia salmonicolor]PRY91368.1 Cu(I)/Ag(I) efflux system membrane fusion protein [Marinilabilia salmonicolor]
MNNNKLKTQDVASQRRKTIITIIIALVSGLLLGWLIFGESGGDSGSAQTQNIASQHDHAKEETTWTCSMHPQIKQPDPGDCPICGMELIPLEEDDGGADPGEIRMSPTAMQLASIQTQKVTKGTAHKTVRLDGKVEADERKVYSQSSHVPGRIEKLTINFTGQYVKKGSPVAYVYSPELVTAQEELFEAQAIKDAQPSLYKASYEKLKNWKLTDAQIETILDSGEPQEQFPVLADVSGYVTDKLVNMGDYIKRGQTIYKIADLSSIWILFDVYESEIPWIEEGNEVTFTVSSLPGKTFSGNIDYIDPVINPTTRVAKARVEVQNSDLKLKPEMFVSGEVEAGLSNEEKKIVVPQSAVMWTGKRSVVYVKKSSEDNVSFTMREVLLGPDLGNSYIIEEGLEAGEEIAVHGTFSIDAAAQLSGKPSMMSPEGGEPATGHNHGSMSSEEMEEMEGTNQKPEDQEIPSYEAPQQFKKQLTAFFDQYIEMKDALVASDAKLAANEAKESLQALKNTDMALLKGDAHMFWMRNLDKMESALTTISGSEDLEAQRKAFVNFNPIFYNKVKAFGLDGKTAYFQFCPMANDDKGAYWLSTEESIRNPYYGDMMLECGEVRETLE